MPSVNLRPNVPGAGSVGKDQLAADAVDLATAETATQIMITCTAGSDAELGPAVASSGGVGGQAGVFCALEKEKLDGIATAATANATDAALRDRTTHTGTQVAATISDFAAEVLSEVTDILVAGANMTITPGSGTLTLAASASGGGTLADGNYTDVTASSSGSVITINAGAVNAAKLATDAVDTAKVANSAITLTKVHADVLARANHTGTIASTVISDFAEAVQDTIGAAIVSGTGITATYDDGAGTITISGHVHSNAAALNAISAAGSGSIITSAERTKLGYISVTGSVDLDNILVSSLEDFSQYQILGRVNSGSGAPSKLSASQTRTCIGITDIGSGSIITSTERTNLGALATLSGVAAGSTNLGTFTGTTIADSSTVKTALQGLETGLETGLANAKPWLMGADYGLVGDGSTNNNTALANAITAANSAGRALFIPKGTYLVNASWSAVQVTNLTLIGEPGTIIKHSAGPTGVTRTNSENLIRLADGGSVRLRGLTFEDFGRVVDIDDQANIVDLDVDDCTFDACVECIAGEANYTSSFLAGPWPIGTVERCVIRNSRFLNTRIVGVRIRSEHLKYALVADNVFDGWTPAPSAGHGWRGVLFWDKFPLTTDPVTDPNHFDRKTFIDRNVFKNVDLTGHASQVCNGVQVQGSYCQVTNNHFENLTCTTKSMLNEGVYIKARFADITGNTFYNAGQYQGAINVKGAPEDTSLWNAFGGSSTWRDNYGYAIRVKDNHIVATDAASVPRIGIHIWTGGSVQVTGNYVQGCSRGIMVAMSSVVDEQRYNWTISDNIVRDCRSYTGANADSQFNPPNTVPNAGIDMVRDAIGIMVQGALSFSKITGNVIEDVQVDYSSRSAYGLVVSSAGYIPIGLTVAYNDIRNITKVTGTNNDCVYLQTSTSMPFYDLRFENNSLRDATLGVRFGGDTTAVQNSTGFIRGNSTKNMAATIYDIFVQGSGGVPAGIIAQDNWRWGASYSSAPTQIVFDGDTNAWAPANYVTDRVFDANSTSLDEVADVLGTLINELKTTGVLRAQ